MSTIIALTALVCLIKAYLVLPMGDSFTLGIARGFKKVKPTWSEEEEKELQDLEFRNTISNFWLLAGVLLLSIAGILTFLYPAQNL